MASRDYELAKVLAQAELNKVRKKAAAIRIRDRNSFELGKALVERFEGRSLTDSQALEVMILDYVKRAAQGDSGFEKLEAIYEDNTLKEQVRVKAMIERARVVLDRADKIMETLND